MLVDDEEERANNRAGLDKLAGMLKSEEQSSDPASVMKDLESSRDKLLQQAQQSKAAKMQPLESRRKRWKRKWNGPRRCCPTTVNS